MKPTTEGCQRSSLALRALASLPLRTLAGREDEAKRFWFLPLARRALGNTRSQKDGDLLFNLV